MKGPNNTRPRLSHAMIRELEEIRIRERMSFRRFRVWMNAPFTAVTLRSALLGRPLWKPNYEFLVKFLKELHSAEGSQSHARTT